MRLPEDFDIFPDEYFDLIVHNHVLEHIPGTYREHLARFLDILKPGGHMVFTVPVIRKDRPTLEGGEDLASNDERLKVHGQVDHYKTFGTDFLPYCNALPAQFYEMDISGEKRVELQASKLEPVFVLTKS